MIAKFIYDYFWGFHIRKFRESHTINFLYLCQFIICVHFVFVILKINFSIILIKRWALNYLINGLIKFTLTIEHGYNELATGHYKHYSLCLCYNNTVLVEKKCQAGHPSGMLNPLMLTVF